MSKKEDDDFAAWQAKFAQETFTDPEAQAAWKVLTEKAGDKVRDEFYRGTLRQSEFHRQLNETQRERQAAAEERQRAAALIDEHNRWFSENNPKHEQALRRAEVLARVVQEAGLLGNDPSAQQLANEANRQMSGMGATAEEIEQIKQTQAALGRGLPAYLRDMGAVNDELRRNNWSVGLVDVQDYSNTRGVSLTQALAELTAEERKTRQEEAIQKQIDSGVEAKLRERMASLPTPDYARRAPSLSVGEFDKQVEQLRTPNGLRDAALAEIRNHMTGGGAQ